ncbi:undecaprenyl-diphosphate phosphatase [Patescibacteria group bacterium]|nr:undecaprenyl-diphosphate phosphatase [Patescibacteria group bacterium]
MIVYILLGFMQGIFEWIPISSEGVVALASQFLVKGINPVDIALFLHLGTFLAVMVYFWKDWKEVLLLKNKELLKFLTIATLVSLAIGFVLYNFVSKVVLGTGLLFITGFGLLFTAFFNKRREEVGIAGNKLALVAGIFQGLAVIPGFSRSASTIFALSLGKKSPFDILKLSYMMSAPVVLASSGYIFLKNPAILINGWIALPISFLVGLASLKILLNISSRISFVKFAVIFGIICLLGGLMGLVI